MSDQPRTFADDSVFGDSVGSYVSRRSLPNVPFALEAETLPATALRNVRTGSFDALFEQAESIHRFGPQKVYPGIPQALTQSLGRSDFSWTPRAIAPLRLYELLSAGIEDEELGAQIVAVMELAFEAPWVITETSPPGGVSLMRLGTEATVIVSLGQSGDARVVVAGVFGLVALRLLYEPAGAAAERLADWIRRDEDQDAAPRD